MAMAIRQRHADFSGRPDNLAALAPLDALTSISLKDRPKLRSLAGLGQLPDLTHAGIYGASRLDRRTR